MNVIKQINPGRWAFFCPACDRMHVYESSWSFNGDFKKPTFIPSLHNFHPKQVVDGKTVPQKTVCHLFVRDGKIKYCSDCPHKYAGKTIEMVPIEEKQ